MVTADGNKVDTSNVSLGVSTTVKVAAPTQGAGEGDGQPAASDADNKSALAKTSDSIPVFAVAAVAVIAIAAIAVAVVAARRSRRQ